MAEELTIVRAFPRVANVFGSRIENTRMRSSAAMTTPYLEMTDVIFELVPALGVAGAAERESWDSGLLSDETTDSGVVVGVERRSIS
jgi:hypothetical protein